MGNKLSNNASSIQRKSSKNNTQTEKQKNASSNNVEANKPATKKKPTESTTKSNKLQHKLQLKHYKNQIICAHIKTGKYVDKASYLIVFGIIKLYSSRRNMLIPTDVTNTLLLYYVGYNTTFITSFDSNYYDRHEWKLSSNNKTIKSKSRNIGTYNPNEALYGPVYGAIGCLDQNGHRYIGFTNGIHYAAIKYIKGYTKHATCCFGVTSHVNIANETFSPGLFGSFFDGNDYPYWTIGSIVTIELNLDNNMIYYYKESKQSERKLIRKIVLNKSEAYCFMLYAEPVVNDQPQKFSIVW
eukprot:69726_1